MPTLIRRRPMSRARADTTAAPEDLSTGIVAGRYISFIEKQNPARKSTASAQITELSPV
jgi:hypothetical protein